MKPYNIKLTLCLLQRSLGSERRS